MTDADRQFLLAVLADPADDTVRMAWADHLQDRGHSAGEFMSSNLIVSLLQDGLPKRSDEYAAAMLRCERSESAARSLMSILFDDAEWTKECQFEPLWSRSLAPLGKLSVSIVRGLPVQMNCPMDWWMEYGPEVVSVAPITSILLTDREPREETGVLWLSNVPPAGRSWTWYDAYHRYTYGPSPLVAGGRWQEDRSALWHDLARHIKGDRISRGRFRSREDAVKILSDCCLIYARGEAVRRELVPDGMWGIEREEKCSQTT